MNAETFLTILEVYHLMLEGRYTDAVDVLVSLINATRNYSLDYDPSWEEKKNA